MIISKKRKFIFFHNPKVAGTSFRSSIEKYHDFGRAFWGEEQNDYLGIRIDLAHIRAWEIPIVAPNLFLDLDKYRKIVFVRNPARRFMSSCFEHFKKYRPTLKFTTHDVATQQGMIEEFVISQLSRKLLISDIRYIHFSLQLWYIYHGDRRIVDHIIPLSEKNDDMMSAYDILEIQKVAAPRQNRGIPHRFDLIMSKEFTDFVEKFYAQDYKMLSGHDHLKHLVEPSDTSAAK